MGSEKNKYLGDIYPTYQLEQPLPKSELPSYMIEVKLSLRENIKQDWFHYLKDGLQRNNMHVSGDRNNTITVKGIPPEYDFNQQNILEIVQEYDAGALMISSRELPI